MNEAIGQALPFAIAVGISPVPIVGVVMMLTTPRASRNSLSFLAGWTVGLALAGTLVLVISSGAGVGQDGSPAAWVTALRLTLGLLLLVVAFRQWSGRPRKGTEPAIPGWAAGIDQIRTPRACGLGLLFSTVNPKNLVLILGAGTAIAQTGVPARSQAIALAVFVLIGTLGPGLPVAIHLAIGERSRPTLEALRVWMSRHNKVIMAIICLILGVKLIGDGITGIG